jgi:hypothetical protein
MSTMGPFFLSYGGDYTESSSLDLGSCHRQIHLHFNKTVRCEGVKDLSEVTFFVTSETNYKI